MEEQTTSPNTPTPESPVQPAAASVSTPEAIRPSPKASGGKTSLLAAVLILLIVLLAAGVILLKPSAKTEEPTPRTNTSTRSATRSSTATQSATPSSNR